MRAEQDDRMAETFIAVGDALRRSPVPTYGIVMERTPDLPRPAYLPPVPPQTPAQYRAALAKLGKLGIATERRN